MKPADIALVNFPFTDLSGSKRRPVLIVGVSPTCPAEDEIVVTAQITGSRYLVRNCKRGDLLIQNWGAASLKKESIVRCRRVFGLTPADILRVFGTLDDATFSRVQDELRRVLDL